MNNLFEGEERFTLTRVQLANWGTFSGIHDIAISSLGHLFVGGSGSGKSTILDAMSALLSPRASYFNAAARQGERRSDRSFVSYIRGAWSSEQDKDGRATSKYLREGSTFSAVAMTFESNQKTEISLLFIGYIQGKSRDESSVRKRYFIIRGPVELSKIRDFGTSGFDIRMIKQRFENVESFQTFSSYSEQFMKYFSIGSSKVLDLLHKAKSAKNMGDINQFFRDFMLAEPKTFALADTLVENFSRLQEAYTAVKDARLQLEVLSKAKTNFDDAIKTQEKLESNDKLRSEINGWVLNLRKKLCEKELPQIQEACSKAEQLLSAAKRQENDIRDRIDGLRRMHYEKGGDRIEHLKTEKKHIEDQIAKVNRSITRLSPDFEMLKRSKPRALSGWIELQKNLKEEKQTEEARGANCRDKEEEIAFELRKETEKFEELKKEIVSMKKQPSNIPSQLIKLRETIVAEIGLKASDMPFVGELLQIKKEESVWQGAAERVLHQFASSVLVREADYGNVARFVDRTNLGTRLVYHRVMPVRNPSKNLAENSLPEKFEIKQGQWAKWLKNELSLRFDYACVDSTAQFGSYAKAVTLAGQIKHNDSRHEKDDRHKISDRRHWITGFTNEQKLADYEAQARDLAATIAQKQSERRQLQEEVIQIELKIKSCEKLLDTEWEDIDEGTPKARLAGIIGQIEELESNNVELKKLAEDIAQAEKELRETSRKREKLSEEKGAKDSKLAELNREIQETCEQLSRIELDQEILRDLTIIHDEHFDPQNLTRKSQLEREGARLTDYFSKEHEKLSKHKLEAEQTVVGQFDSFLKTWQSVTTDLDASLNSAPEFFQKLDSIEKDGLPKFEQKFRDILENSTKQNLINLFREIDEERRDIKSRMNEVNESLKDAVFNKYEGYNSHLIIDVKDLRLREYEDFKKEHNRIITTDTKQMSLRDAENYYQGLESLIQKIEGREPEQLLWRNKVLDAREHVSFQGREVDDKDQTVDIYDSGLGKSGGQRQKLTLTCLVAALRYQLGRRKTDLPSFAPIIMDEAFDKADNEFTDISLKIFRDFGFQPVVATPLKGLLTLEPYMGSFAYISCEERRRSSVIPVQLTRLKKMLRGDESENS